MSGPTGGKRSSRAPGIRRVTMLISLSFGVVILVVVAAMIWSSDVLQRAMDEVARDTRSEALANEVEAGVLAYQRLGNLHLITKEPEVAAERADIAVQIHKALARGEALVSGQEEQRLLEQLNGAISSYLAARTRYEAQGLRLSELVRLSTPALNDVLDDLTALRALNEDQVARAYDQAARVDGLTKSVGLATVAVLVAGLLGISMGLRRYLLHPILALHQVMERFRSGDLGVRARARGVGEVDDLAHMFNEMSAAMAQQREAQLTFLAGIAHDLRNPLNALKVGIYTLEHEQSETRRGWARSRLDHQVDLLTRMIDDLLDGTRIEAGQLHLRPRHFDIRNLVRDMVWLYSPTAPRHQLVADMPELPMSVYADPARIEQVMSNLLSNAIKYSPLGGPVRITVCADGDAVLLTIADTGIGIPAQDTETIFLPFRRRSFDVAPGVGLGLSVVRRIVQAHGGEIHVTSEPDVGSSFTVRIPRVCQTPALEHRSDEALA